MARVLTLPLTVAANGAMATVTQDSSPEITQSVALLLDTRPGERRTLPDYGLPDPLFSGVDPNLVAEVIDEWEPRAETELIELVVAGAFQAVDVHLTEEA
ncbi:GPW/gp25 family protein [Nocardioides sp.]|uniref:GPW/gp25 family protein n=1 Tax=Nocardioides sp. TaxID=35761 RepID=UPI002CE498F6|nr:GPW/gp25 family protein [Nocardioides sp.]HXH77323.1 GPW/gp25 family protein [Nocardioides sp.]